MIRSYEFGRIVIDAEEYTRDVIIYPDRVDATWWRREGHELRPEDIGEVLKASPEVLVVGQGYDGCMRILPETERLLREKGIELRSALTERACKTYNDLANKGKRVIAALHLTC